ncbi:MAG: glycosyltransferase family 9 protein [Terriglobales bacterium]
MTRPRALPAELQRILLLRWERLGDVVVTLPALAAVRAAWPTAQITLVVRPEFVAWLRHAGVADDVVGLVPPWQGPSLRNARNLLRWTQHFDVAFDFLGDPRNLACARVLARHAVGYPVRGGGFLLSRVAEYRPDLPIAQQHLQLVARAGPIIGADPVARLPLTQLCREAAEALLPPHVCNFVVLHPGAGQPSKAWPHWERLAAQHRCGAEICVVTGTALEAHQCAALERVLRRSGRAVWNLAGRTSVPALAGILARARLVVAPDTGVVHLARALGTPTLALFGPVNPRIWGYAEPRHRSLAVAQPCSYCEQRHCPRRDYPGRCLAEITPAAVAAAISDLLGPLCTV